MLLSGTVDRLVQDGATLGMNPALGLATKPQNMAQPGRHLCALMWPEPWLVLLLGRGWVLQSPLLPLPQHIGLPMFAADRKPKRIHLMSLGVLNLPRNALLDWSFGHSLISCHVEHHLFPSLSDNMCLKVRQPHGVEDVLGGDMGMRPSISPLRSDPLITLPLDPSVPLPHTRDLSLLYNSPILPHGCFSWLSTPCSFPWSQFQPAASTEHSGTSSLGKSPPALHSLALG